MSTLTFAEPLPGLAPHTDFTLEAVDGAAGLFSLRPDAAPDIRLFLLDAAVYVPGYEPEISAPCRSLGLGSPEEARVLVVATPGEGGTTVNLMAPVIVNEATGQSAQAILDGQGWPLRMPLG
ncbi:flagellar assembly protein FliW [Sinomonas susongensis]|uniref:flagellar assembly protein FliW n=1 Tax=Sinomonas susongensis TaxID=1324851 RepID=UPI001109243B|nr:flagellar assembly protein FliW [Sinomonas susongensis]